jgi:hypothetical protein
MPITERRPFGALPFNQISFAITEFPDLDLTFCVFAMKLESDSIFESFKP